MDPNGKRASVFAWGVLAFFALVAVLALIGHPL